MGHQSRHCLLMLIYRAYDAFIDVNTCKRDIVTILTVVIVVAMIIPQGLNR